MRVADVRTRVLAIPHRGRYHWAIGAPEGTNNVLVEVHTDEGIVGYGDACGTRSAAATAAVINDLRHLVIGESPFRIEHIVGQFYRHGPWSNQRRFGNQAIAGIEMALWDICGKALGQPVHNLLGGRVRDDIHWFGFVQGDRPEDLAEDARALVGRGFDVLYLKVGLGEERDVSAVRAVREAAGPDARLRLDPNEAWDHLTALRMIRRLREFEIDWVEQPLDFRDLAGHAALRRQVDVPIVLDQAVFTDADVLSVIRHDAADAVVIGFHETGGLLNLRKAAIVADVGGLPVNRHAVIGESGISTLAAIQVLATIPNLTDGHQVMHELFVDDVLVDGTVVIENGRSRVSDRPGLGIEIDWDRVERFERLYERVGQYPM